MLKEVSSLNVDVTIELFIALFVLFGAIISVISAYGIIRFPDVYSRLHAGTKSSTLAVLITLLGALLFFLYTEGIFSVRLILGIVFVFITSPVSGHLICRASYRSNVKMTETTTVDELKDVLRTERINEFKDAINNENK